MKCVIFGIIVGLLVYGLTQKANSEMLFFHEDQQIGRSDIQKLMHEDAKGLKYLIVSTEVCELKEVPKKDRLKIDLKGKKQLFNDCFDVKLKNLTWDYDKTIYQRKK